MAIFWYGRQVQLSDTDTMSTELSVQLNFSIMEMSEADEELFSVNTPYLNQLLAEIAQYRERQRVLANSSAKQKAKPAPPESVVRNNVSVLTLRAKSSLAVRQAAHREKTIAPGRIGLTALTQRKKLG